MLHSVVRSAIQSYRRSRIKPLRAALLKAYRMCRVATRKRAVITRVAGITYELDLNETIDSAIYYEGCFEPHTTAVIQGLCRPGMTVLDIGANIGCHSLRFSNLVGPSGRVIAFEPMAPAFAKLQRNAALNSFSKNLTLEKLALSNEVKERQEVALACSWPLTGVGEASRHAVHGGCATRDIVDFITLDGYVRDRNISQIDLIKLDVDGHEFKVVCGAAETLRSQHPLLIMELGVYSLAEAGDRVEDLVRFLERLGYSFYDEKGLRKFASLEAILAAIPERATINAVASARALSPFQSA